MATDDAGEEKKLPLSHRRKSGSETRQKGRVLTLRVSEQDYQAITADANSAGLTVGTYIRDCVLKTPRTARRRRPLADVAALSAAHRQVRAVGGNLNQIARSLNSGETRAADNLPKVLTEVQDALSLVRQAMGMEA